MDRRIVPVALALSVVLLLALACGAAGQEKPKSLDKQVRHYYDLDWKPEELRNLAERLARKLHDPKMDRSERARIKNVLTDARHRLMGSRAYPPQVVYDPGYMFVGKMGKGGGEPNFGCGDGEFDNPTGVAVGPGGVVYVVDRDNQRVQKFDSAGAYITQWGDQGSGDGQFDYPKDVAVDAAGNVYVIDADNARVQKFDADGNYLTQWGSYGSGNSQFRYPAGIAVDSTGNVYVTDTWNHRIQKFASNGTYLTQWGSEGSGNGQFDYPKGVAVDAAGNVYVADSDNDRVQKFNSTGTYITQWGSSGDGDGQFCHARGIAVGAGKVYVADVNRDDIQVFDTSGNYLDTWGEFGYADGDFNMPRGLCLDASGNVYVADTDNHRVQMLDSCGAFLTKWGRNGGETNWGGGDGEFIEPYGIDFDAAGNFYVADMWNFRIQKFDSAGNYLDSWGSYGVEPGEFDYPSGVAVDPSGNVFVTDAFNCRVQKFDSNGNYLDSWGDFGVAPGEFFLPTGITADSTGNVYVADYVNNRIQKFDNDGVFLDVWGANGGDGSPGDGDGEFFLPSDIAVDAAGNFYVADSWNDRIQKFDAAGNFVGEWGVYGWNPGEFDYPFSLALDSRGNLLVAEWLGARVQVFDTDGNFLSTWGCFGSEDGEFFSPAGITVNPLNGYAYVTDSDLHRIQIFAPVQVIIGGAVTFGGAPMAGVAVNLSGGATGSMVTGADGLYEFAVDFGSNVTVTPAMDGYVFDPAESVFTEITSDQTQNFAAALITGSLTVNLEPEGARTRGGMWRVAGGAWRASGYTETGLDVGTVTVEFNSVPGYRSPAAVALQILVGQTTEHTATYTETGALMVNIEPPGAVAAGAQWRRVGAAEWRASGTWEHGLIVGSYDIEFKEVGGWITPQNRPVTIGFEEEKVLAVQYVKLTGSLTVSIFPKWAGMAGAQWRLQGEPQWRPPSVDSEPTPPRASIEIEPGDYTIEFLPAPGWYCPSIDVEVMVGEETKAEGRYLPILVADASDYDGDGTADYAVFNVDKSTWSVMDQFERRFGKKGDLPAPGDYDGDGSADLAAFRPSNGNWFVRGQFSIKGMGREGDLPAPADYDGDGRTDAALYRPATGTWLISYSAAAAPTKSAVVEINFGGDRHDIPVPGDYDGDSRAEPALYNTNAKTWTIRGWDEPVKFGRSGEVPVPADYDGDGLTDVAVVDLANGLWRVSGGPDVEVESEGDFAPVFGDFDGDGVVEVGAFNPARAVWALLEKFIFGEQADIPLVRGNN